ncbi:MAG: carboxypeptidase-like regulatory domain-containing protein [Cyclobacteriaceae bacterium]
MKTFLFGILFTGLVGFTAFAQKPVINATFDQVGLDEVFIELEKQSGMRFYFDTSYIDSLSFTGEFHDLKLESALGQIIEGTRLTFYTQGKKVFILYDTQIIGNLPILEGIQEKPIKAEFVQKGLVFTREYLSKDNVKAGVESQVVEIGSRKKLVPDGSSTIAGYIKDADTGDPIAGAIVYSKKLSLAATSDPEGFYSITLPNGRLEMLVQHVSMKTTKRNVVLFSNGQLNIDLEVNVIALRELTVEADRDDNLEDVQMGVQKISIVETKNVPIVLGERDIMKIATTFAGVQTVGEGASGFNVRGGKSDQNLVLFNDATIYNASHFFGFFSVFNSDAIEDMQIYKSGIPAAFGGRLSSVFDIRSKKPGTTKLKGVGGISPITSKLTLEIPIEKSNAGLMLSGRTTYSNWVLRQVKNAEFSENEAAFSDLIVKYDQDLNPKDKLSVSGYFSRDRLRLNSDTLFSFSDFSFVNANAAIKWTRQLNGLMDVATTATYSKYGYEMNYDQSPPNAFKQDFGISEASLKLTGNYYPGEEYMISGGIESKYLSINPGTKVPRGEESIVLPKALDQERALESSIFASYEYKPSDQITLYGGLRYTFFSVFGSQTVYEYAANQPRKIENQVDSTSYGPGEIVKTYHGPELRLSARYALDQASSLKASYNRTRQYVHTLSNSASLSPTDTWRLSSEHIVPQVSDQFSVGYYKNILGNKFETSVEFYYKHLQNLLDFKVGSDFLLNDNIETAVLQGNGKAYGMELSLKKKGKLNGWFNYSYARTLIKLDGSFPEERVNQGEFYPTNYDKPHTVNLVANYKLTHRLSLSYNFTYNTGRPVTVPVASYDFKGIQNVHYADRNSFRIPSYMRMDLGINLEAGHKIKQFTRSYWSLSIYNLLGRDNPYSVFFDLKNGQVNGYQLVIFGSPIPTLTYNFRF